jgi:hypothetical protein
MEHTNTEPLTQDEEFCLYLARTTPNGETVQPASEFNHGLAWGLAVRGLLNIIDGRVFLTAFGALVLAPMIAAREARQYNQSTEPYTWKPTPFPVLTKKNS